MKQQPAISFQGIEASDAVESKIRERIERLDRYAPEIIKCRFVVSTPHRHKKKGRLYQVSLRVSVPGDQIVVNHSQQDEHAHEDIYVAIRDGFDAAERQLKEYAERRRGETKKRSGSDQGVVARLFPEDGYGFITPREGGGHVYFHRNSIVDGSFEDLEEETPVAYHPEEGEEGPQASTVHILGKHQVVPGN